MSTNKNKKTSMLASERASAPETRRRHQRKAAGIPVKKDICGSVTIEASIGIPLFLFAAVCLIWLIEIHNIRLTIFSAAQNAAKSAAEQTALVPVLNTVKLKSDIIELVGEERIDRSLIKGGASGISCWKSHVSPSAGEMEVFVDYSVRLPLQVFGNPSARLEEAFILSAWTGYQGGRDGAESGQIVYVTENEGVYHEDYSCSHLQLSIRYVPASELDEMRNDSGGRYHACEKCVFGPAMTGVYITETGDRYHNSISCSGLKRTIRAVDRDEVSGLGGCSRCSD